MPRINDDEMGTYDEIKKAAHYQPDAHPSQLECIVMVEDMDFCIGNGLKYLYRAGKKPGEERTKTLAKAEYYFRRKAKRLTETAHRIVPPWLSHEVRQGLHRWACSGAPEASIVQNVLQAYADPVRGYWEMVKAADRCVELMQNGERYA